MTGKAPRIPKAWNPKLLGVKKSTNGNFETDVWCYIANGKLSVIVQVNRAGVMLGQTAYHDAARLPKS